MKIFEKTYPYETSTKANEHLVMAIEGPLPAVCAIAASLESRYRQCGEEESSTHGHTVLFFRVHPRDKQLIIQEFHALCPS